MSRLTPDQHLASDPRRNIFVSANAGSGKTHVLVARVSRILLSGVAPSKILCLTYTKAAASEMQSRLFKSLGRWSILSEAELTSELDDLMPLGRPRTEAELRKARALFAQALETPEGLNIQTIHAFCERILSRFPIEAGILPGFQTMDDIDSADLKTHILETCLRDIHCAAHDENELGGAVHHLMGHMGNKNFEALLSWMCHGEYKIKAWKRAGGMAPLAKYCNLNPNDDPVNLIQKFWAGRNKEALKPHIHSLSASTSKTDRTKGDILRDVINEDDPEQAFALYKKIFLTQKGTIFSSVVTKQSSPSDQAFFGIKDATTPETEAVYQLSQDLLTLGHLKTTSAVYTLACYFTKAYEQAKYQQHKLDFTDQIMRVRALLTRKDVSDWVRYKLDGGVEHILVDEAQDTSPEQWAIIDAIAEAFAYDEDHRQEQSPRTLFAVGDEKQSIYSFQGARPELFLSRAQEQNIW